MPGSLPARRSGNRWSGWPGAQRAGAEKKLVEIRLAEDLTQQHYSEVMVLSLNAGLAARQAFRESMVRLAWSTARRGRKETGRNTPGRGPDSAALLGSDGAVAQCRARCPPGVPGIDGQAGLEHSAPGPKRNWSKYAWPRT